MKKAVIFDLDGTLLDTLCDLHTSVNFTMEHYGFPTRTIDEVRSFIGNGVPKLVERSSPAGTDACLLREEVKTFEEHYREHCRDNTSAYDGIIDVLKTLKDKGLSVGVVSNKVDFATKKLCEEYFGDLVDVAQGKTEDVPAKPSPISLLRTIEVLRAERAVYVGDSDVDILTARGAGVECISVSWGFRASEFLMENGAKYVANDMNELLSLIYELCEV